MLVIEDVHWADSSTLELLDRLAVNERPGLMVLASMRPDGGRLPWSGSTAEVIMLAPLEMEARRDLIQWLTHPHPLPDELESRVLERSNGIPLFLEELARTYSDPSIGPNVILPPTLRDLLTERLDRAGPDKELAQVAATIGMEVPVRLLSAVVDERDDALQPRLERLTAAGLLDRDIGGADETFVFRHSLVRDAAYTSQLLSRRRIVHARIAQAIEDGQAGPVQPALLGLHFMQAELWLKAAHYYQTAGTQAQASGAASESIQLQSEALRAARQLPEGVSRDEAELRSLIARSASHASIRGYAAPEIGSDLELSLAICQRTDSSVAVLSALTYIWAYYAVSGALDRSTEVLAEMRAMVQRPELAQFSPEIAICESYDHFFRGRFRACLSGLPAAIDAYQGRLRSGGAAFWPLPNDPGVAGLAIEACAAWIIGEHELFADALEEAQSAAAVLPFPVGAFSEAYAATYGAYAYHVAGDFQRSLSLAARATAIGETYGFGFWLICGRLLSLAAEAQLSPADPAATVEALRQMLHVYQLTGTGSFLAADLCYLAEAYLSAGQPDSSLQAASAAFETSQRGERFHLAEILRLKALALRELDPDSVEPAKVLIESIEVARQQDARAFELRSAAALVRLQPPGVAAADARAFLRRAVEAFPAVSEWPELEEARLLLSSAA
jgi:hypothetical protein